MKKCNNFILVFDMTLKNHLKCGLISSIHERHTSIQFCAIHFLLFIISCSRPDTKVVSRQLLIVFDSIRIHQFYLHHFLRKALLNFAHNFSLPFISTDCFDYFCLSLGRWVVGQFDFLEALNLLH